MTDTVNTRRLALDVLLEVTEHGAYSNQVLRAVLEKYQYMEKYERAFDKTGGGNDPAHDRT